VLAVLVLALPCGARAQDEPAAVAPGPFESEAALAAWARHAGAVLSNKHFDLTTINAWSALVAPIGLQYHDGGKYPNSGYSGIWLGHGYGIASRAESKEGDAEPTWG
jgi:hypothetical protein